MKSYPKCFYLFPLNVQKTLINYHDKIETIQENYCRDENRWLKSVTCSLNFYPEEEGLIQKLFEQLDMPKYQCNGRTWVEKNNLIVAVSKFYDVDITFHIVEEK